MCVYVLSNFGLFEFSATRVNLCGAVLNLMCTILSSNLFVTIATVFRTSCEFAKIPNLLKRMVVFDHAQTIQNLINFLQIIGKGSILQFYPLAVLFCYSSIQSASTCNLIPVSKLKILAHICRTACCI